MGLISSTGALIAGAVTAIAGHFIVHDLYEGAPRHAKRLLDYAVKVLPEIDRGRYAEEWLAHLHECKGVIEKFRHAMECLLIARKLRQIVERRGTADPHDVEFVFLSKGLGTAKVLMDVTTALPVLKILEEAQKLAKLVRPEAFVPSKEIQELLANPDVKRDRLLEIKAAIERVRASGEPGFKVHIVDRFGRAMTKHEMTAWLKENDD
jgi:hypothetical protein